MPLAARLAGDAVPHVAVGRNGARARADRDRLGLELRAFALVEDPRVSGHHQRRGGLVVGRAARPGLAAGLGELDRTRELGAFRVARHGIERGVERLALDAARRPLRGIERLGHQHREPARAGLGARASRTRRVERDERALLVELEAQARRRHPPPLGRLLRAGLELERRRVGRGHLLQHALAAEDRLEPLAPQPLARAARGGAGQRGAGSGDEIHVARGGGALDGVHVLVHVQPQVVGAELAGPLRRLHRSGEGEDSLLARARRGLRLDVRRAALRVLDPHLDALAQQEPLAGPVLEPGGGSGHRAALEAQRVSREGALLVAPVLEGLGLELEAVVRPQQDLALEGGAVERGLVLALLRANAQQAGAPLVHERHRGVDAVHQHRVAVLLDGLLRLDVDLAVVVAEAKELQVADGRAGSR